MSKAENIHNTLKWKKKRKEHFADKCNRVRCGICHPHKRFSKRISKLWNKKQTLENIKLKESGRKEE